MQPELRTVLRVLQLYLKVAIFQPELRPRTTLALKSCDFCLEKLPRTRRGSTPRLRDSESSRANNATTSKDHFASNKFARRRSESASTRTILAEDSASIFDFRIEKPLVFAHRPRRSPQRVHPGMSKSQQTLSFLTSTTRVSAEGRSHRSEIEKSPQFFDLDHTNLRRGSLAHRRNRKKSSVF